MFKVFLVGIFVVMFGWILASSPPSVLGQKIGSGLKRIQPVMNCRQELGKKALDQDLQRCVRKRLTSAHP